MNLRFRRRKPAPVVINQTFTKGTPPAATWANGVYVNSADSYTTVEMPNGARWTPAPFPVPAGSVFRCGSGWSSRCDICKSGCKREHTTPNAAAHCLVVHHANAHLPTPVPGCLPEIGPRTQLERPAVAIGRGNVKGSTAVAVAWPHRVDVRHHQTEEEVWKHLLDLAQRFGHTADTDPMHVYGDPITTASKLSTIASMFTIIRPVGLRRTSVNVADQGLPMTAVLAAYYGDSARAEARVKGEPDTEAILNTPVMPLAEQFAAIEPHLGPAVRANFPTRSEQEQRDIIDLALERFAAGFNEYGDASFQLHPDQLAREGTEEAADLVVWAAIRAHVLGADPAAADAPDPGPSLTAEAVTALMESGDAIKAARAAYEALDDIADGPAHHRAMIAVLELITKADRLQGTARIAVQALEAAEAAS